MGTQGIARILFAVGLLVACDGRSPRAPVASPRGRLSDATPVSRTPVSPFFPSLELFQVCMKYTGETGPDVTIDFVVRGDHTDSSATTLAAGECQNVWIGDETYDT